MLDNFHCQGVRLIAIVVGPGPTVLGAGAGAGAGMDCLDIFPSPFSTYSRTSMARAPLEP